jgi:hypothetical protein
MLHKKPSGALNNPSVENATWLKENEDRQAYAIDRMALPYSEWRTLQNEKWWKSNNEAKSHVYDRTAFNLVTNFVRSKRLEEM